MNKIVVLASFVALTSVTGCYGRAGRNAFLGILAIDAAAHIIAAQNRQVIVVTEAAPMQPPSPGYVDAPPAPVVGGPFDPVAAQTALSQLDPGKCWPSETPGGYATINAYFASAGYIKAIAVESGPPSADNKCLSDTFRTATVPPFSGSGVNVKSRYFVGAGS
jgi:hypothetical protein